LATQDVLTAMTLLVQQMKDNAQSVTKPTISVSVTRETLSAPTLNTVTAQAGGSLSAATYFYKLTSLSPSGETILGNEVSGTTAGGNLTLRLAWTAVTGSTGYRIYRGTSAGVQDKLVTTIASASTVTYDDAGAAVVATTTPATNRAYKNNGASVVIASVLGGDGKQMDYVFDEKIVVTATADSQGTGTLDREPFSVVGVGVASDPLDWSWPLGSGANTQTNSIDATQDAVGNLLTNSDFDAFTVANQPDNWVVVVGDLGTTVFSSGSSDAYKGTNALKIVGNGSQLQSITQQFNVSSGGTTSTLSPRTVYGVNTWAKVGATPAGGTVVLEMIDGSNNIINDDEGNANSISLNLTTVPANIYIPLNGFFRTPLVLPSIIKLRLRFTVALSNGVAFFADNLAQAIPTQTYVGGPWVMDFSGATKTIINDRFDVNVTNKYDSEWQFAVERFFGTRNLGLQIPSSASPTIAASLIV